MKYSKNIKYLVGIDEAGRGPLAGPVTVGMVIVPTTFDFSLIEYARDSKQLSYKTRKGLFEHTRILKREGVLEYKVTHIHNKIIDSKGISYAVQEGVKRVLRHVDASLSYIYLDGLLKAPPLFIHQKTIIRGDQKVPLISLASIMAKVSRDTLMEKKAVQYPHYGFEFHKGYGTSLHREHIKKNGLCDMHRKSFCTKLLLQ